jgi:hypothetical protein
MAICSTARAIEHPSLFFTAADLPALRARAQNADAGLDSFYTDLYEEIKIDCRSVYAPGDTIPDSTRKSNAQAIISHGAILLLDPDGRAVSTRYQSSTRFFDYYNCVLNWSGWDNFFGDTPFDTTDFLIALCIGYDWHYSRFSDTQRADIVSKLAARADYLVDHSDTFFELPAELTDPTYFYLHTFKVLRNRDRIPLGALGMIAYTLQGEVDETRRQRWLSKVDQMLGVWDAHVSHDGMSHEGYSYHEYMIQSLFPMLYVRSRRTGINQFTLFEYMKKHPIYSIYSWVPGGDRSYSMPIPFGDNVADPPSDMRTLSAMEAHWLKGDPDHLDQLANWMQYRGPSLTTNVPNNTYSRVGPLQFFLADNSIPMSSPQDLKLPLFHYYPERGGFVWRSGWDNMAMYFAMTCGATIGGHQQPEMGNFTIYKGGAPFIAHHGPTTWRRSEHHNVMLINGQGQYGEQDSSGNASTPAQPPQYWPSITQALGDDLYFDVYANLQPVYRASGIAEYTREYVGVGERIFVRDRARLSGTTQVDFNNLLHGFATTAPSKAATECTQLDINSAPSVNPWSGSSPVWTLTPRTAGPITAGMKVHDLSAFAWTGAIAVSQVKNEGGSFTNRGYKLTRTKKLRSGSSLMGFYFPQAGETIEVWPNTAQEGFRIKRNGNVRALTVWCESDISNESGMTLSGAMGGLDLDATSFWGRAVTNMNYNGVTYFQASTPVAFYALTGGGSGNRVRIISTAQSTVSVYHPQQVTSVVRDGANLNHADWNWSNGILTMTISAATAGTLIETNSVGKNAVDAALWSLLD